MWKREPSCTVVGNVIWCRHYGSTEVSQNIKNRISYNSTSRYLPKEYKNTSVKWYMLPYVHRSVIHKNQDTDATVSTVQFSSVAQSCPTLCDPMNHSTPGLPVHHQLPESTQTHVHWVGEAITGEWIKVYIHIYIKFIHIYTQWNYNSVIKKWNRAISTTWVDLEGTTVSETRQKEKEKYCVISCMRGNYKENKTQWKQTLS